MCSRLSRVDVRSMSNLICKLTDERITHLIFFFKQKTAYEMRISDWSSDVCSSDLLGAGLRHRACRVGAHQIEVAIHAVVRWRAKVVAAHGDRQEIGRASCRERVCQYV